jgi:hypothetical protein
MYLDEDRTDLLFRQHLAPWTVNEAQKEFLLENKLQSKISSGVMRFYSFFIGMCYTH